MSTMSRARACSPPMPSFRETYPEDFQVGWVCALPVELAAAQGMLDKEHTNLMRKLNDEDDLLYALGLIGLNNIVIACPPAGRIGSMTAAAVASQMMATFTRVQCGLMVGIGRGVLSVEADIRLGDVVVSQPDETFGGVVQYDSSKTVPGGFKRTGSLNSPPDILLSALSRMQTNQARGQSRLSEHVAKLAAGDMAFQRKKAGPDTRFEVAYEHKGEKTCDDCSTDRQQTRRPRDSEDVVVHYGTIVSGNQVIKTVAERDRISAYLGGSILCFDMEATGPMDHFPCLAIRGICDYADSHRNDNWQPYAAAVAAAYGKELLLNMRATDEAKQLSEQDATHQRELQDAIGKQMEELADKILGPKPSSHSD